MLAPMYWQEPYYDETPACAGCNSKDQVLDDCGEFLRGVLRHLYSRTEFDAGGLEHDLEELCHYLKVPMPRGDLQITRI